VNDLGASILARLRNKSMETKIPYQQCIQLFIQEELFVAFRVRSIHGILSSKGGISFMLLPILRVDRPSISIFYFGI